MEFRWPNFDEVMELDGSRTWTAAFDSYDQRNENCYYIITLHEKGKPSRRYMAQIDVGWAENDWRVPSFAARLKDRLEWLARAGATNTNYNGPL